MLSSEIDINKQHNKELTQRKICSTMSFYIDYWVSNTININLGFIPCKFKIKNVHFNTETNNVLLLSTFLIQLTFPFIENKNIYTCDNLVYNRLYNWITFYNNNN